MGHPPAPMTREVIALFFCFFCRFLQHQMPLPSGRRLAPVPAAPAWGEAVSHRPCPAAGSPCPQPAPGRQREQEVCQQAQQEGAEGESDAGHPLGHVLRGLAPLLHHQHDAGKHTFCCFFFNQEGLFFKSISQLGSRLSCLHVSPESCGFLGEKNPSKARENVGGLGKCSGSGKCH